MSDKATMLQETVAAFADLRTMLDGLTEEQASRIRLGVFGVRDLVIHIHQTCAVLLAWAFLLSRMIGLGVMVPEAAYEAPTMQVCEAVRETVELVADQGVHVSECKDTDRIYIGVPIYRGPQGESGRQ